MPQVMCNVFCPTLKTHSFHMLVVYIIWMDTPFDSFFMIFFLYSHPLNMKINQGKLIHYNFYGRDLIKITFQKIPLLKWGLSVWKKVIIRRDQYSKILSFGLINSTAGHYMGPFSFRVSILISTHHMSV